MKKLLTLCGSALTSLLLATSPVLASDIPGYSAEKGNRILCVNPFTAEVHQSPGKCAQSVGQFLTDNPGIMGPGFKGGPGVAWKYMRDYGGMNELSNASQCIKMNCPTHAKD